METVKPFQVHAINMKTLLVPSVFPTLLYPFLHRELFFNKPSSVLKETISWMIESIIIILSLKYLPGPKEHKNNFINYKRDFTYSSGQKRKGYFERCAHWFLTDHPSHLLFWYICWDFHSLHHSLLHHCSRKQLWKRSERESKHSFSQLDPLMVTSICAVWLA